MKMTPAALIVGGLLVFWASTFAMIGMPLMTMKETPSETWRALTPVENEGLHLYNSNGCSYCHSMYIRIFDWGIGAERIAERGDYVGFQPIILGTERWGPDLSQEGGEHPDDWHIAHFKNPRYTRPVSVMPSWEFLGDDTILKLTEFLQGMGLRSADYRTARQKAWQEQTRAAFKLGPDKNIEWLHGQVPLVWRAMPNPYPATEPNVLRGMKMYEQFCINCHGAMGDGMGPAAIYLNPAPLNFTSLKRHLVENRYIGGILYYQIMNGITGSSMPYFKKELESEKIWDVSNYVAVNFIGYTDADTEPRGIDAAGEPPWVNHSVPPPIPGK
jgi:cbb3-type cytochrome oxidase cytochrome c subunit